MLACRIAAVLLLGLAVQGAAPPFARAETIPAEAPAAIARLSQTMQLGAVFDVLRAEGLANGNDIADDLLGGAGDAGWTASVARIYAPARMRALFDATLEARLGDDAATLEGAEAFFAAPLGQRILGLEIAARRALLDESAETAARENLQALRAAKAPRLAQIERFVAVNDLVESNVMGALNANLAFLRALAGAGRPQGGLDEGKMLSDVWARENDVRRETQDWLLPFLALAYQPLSDAEMESYIAYSESAPGKRLNAAFFAAFDSVFTTISADLGRAAALQITGQDI